MEASTANSLIGAIAAVLTPFAVALAAHWFPVRSAPRQGPRKRRHEPRTRREPGPAAGVSTEALVNPALVAAIRASKTSWTRALLVLVPLSSIAPILVGFVAFVNLILVVPIATAVLAYRRPVPWQWAVMVVAGLHAINYLSLLVGGALFTSRDLVIALAVYLINFGLVAVTAHVRSEAFAQRHEAGLGAQ